MEYKKENLSALMYSGQDIKFTPVKNVMIGEPGGMLELDLDEGCWSWGNWRNIPIGKCREGLSGEGCVREGIIGVYDLDDFDQLEAFKRDSDLAKRD